jgi:hypothetical protein
VDAVITSTDPNTLDETTAHITGVVDLSVVPERTGCVRPAGPVCLRQGTIVPYRALRSARLSSTDTTSSVYATAATATLAPAVAAPEKRRLLDSLNNWSTSEGPLP